MNKTQFEDFISRGRLDKDGKPVFMTSAELKALNDLCRSEILTLRGGKTSAVRPAATAPVAAVRSAPVAVKPATLTAAEWQAQNAPPTMTRGEWQKLSHGDRGKFFQKGGKLAP